MLLLESTARTTPKRDRRDPPRGETVRRLTAPAFSVTRTSPGSSRIRSGRVRRKERFGKRGFPAGVSEGAGPAAAIGVAAANERTVIAAAVTSFLIGGLP
jgi:hypothetical protein